MRLATQLRRSRGPKVVGLRNLITHEYVRIDTEVIESILSEQLDQLEETAKRLREASAEEIN